MTHSQYLFSSNKADLNLLIDLALYFFVLTGIPPNAPPPEIRPPPWRGAFAAASPGFLGDDPIGLPRQKVGMGDLGGAIGFGRIAQYDRQTGPKPQSHQSFKDDTDSAMREQQRGHGGSAIGRLRGIYHKIDQDNSIKARSNGRRRRRDKGSWATPVCPDPSIALRRIGLARLQQVGRDRR
jgi:hypothetical protein